jgi:hypothetical protein
MLSQREVWVRFDQFPRVLAGLLDEVTVFEHGSQTQSRQSVLSVAKNLPLASQTKVDLGENETIIGADEGVHSLSALRRLCLREQEDLASHLAASDTSS